MQIDARDRENAFALFLGRNANASERAEAEDLQLPALLENILESAEFKHSVLERLLLRDVLPQTRFDPVPPLVLIDWAQTRLPLAVRTRRLAGAMRSWNHLLEVLLADELLVGCSPLLKAAQVDSILHARIQSDPSCQVERFILGCVDSASAFEVRGWCVDLCDKSAPVMLEFHAGDRFLGAAFCTEPRPDLAGSVGGSGNFGFTFPIAEVHRASFAGGRLLTARDAVSQVQVGNATAVYSDVNQSLDTADAIRDELGRIRKMLETLEARLPEVGALTSTPLEAYDSYWQRVYRQSDFALSMQRERSLGFSYRPLISVIVPAWNSDTRLLEKTIRSVRDQSYGNWELIISDDGSANDELNSFAALYVAESRIHWLWGVSQEGIAINSNRAAEKALGDYLAFLDHDDELSPDALYMVVTRLQHRRYKLLYSDEDRIEEDDSGCNQHRTPFFKPDFDPDLLLSVNYICHLTVVRRDVFDDVNGFRPGFEGAQDHDLLLRLVEHIEPEDLYHIPRVLYHWRVTPGSVTRTPSLTAGIQDRINAAVSRHLSRTGVAATVEAHSNPVGKAREFATRIRWHLPNPAPGVSVIIATRDRVDLLKPCFDSVFASLTTYNGVWEILVVDNDSSDPVTLGYLSELARNSNVRVIPFRGKFNYSAINNSAARQAGGEILIFLNNDTVVMAQDWCSELVGSLLRKQVGAVGARLIYGDGTIQHAGVVLGGRSLAGHEHVGLPACEGGYFSRTQLLHSTSAVTAACLATHRKLFLEQGGFDEVHLKVAFNDVDYCLKLRRAGYRVVYNPFAVLYHHESQSRGRDLRESELARHSLESATLRARWPVYIASDPYYNPHFEREARPFDRLVPPPVLD